MFAYSLDAKKQISSCTLKSCEAAFDAVELIYTLNRPDVVIRMLLLHSVGSDQNDLFSKRKENMVKVRLRHGPEREVARRLLRCPIDGNNCALVATATEAQQLRNELGQRVRDAAEIDRDRLQNRPSTHQLVEDITQKLPRRRW